MVHRSSESRSEGWQRSLHAVLHHRIDLPRWKASPSRSPSEPRARNNFDALRLIAALLVVFGHQTMINGREDATGTIGVRLLVFFAISGFLVTGSWHSDPHPVRFLAKRFLRIWPAFAVMTVVCAIVAYAAAPTNLHRLAALFYLNNLYYWGFDWAFFDGRWPLNLSMWMIPHEVNLYLAIATVACFGRRVLRFAACLALGAAVGSALPTTTGGGVFEAWSPYLVGFFAGGVLLREFAVLRDGRFVVASVAVGTVALLLGERTLGLLLIVPTSAVWVGLKSWPVFRSAARFGDLSLGIFLWGWPVQQVLRHWLGTEAPLAVQFAIALPPIVLLAWLSWHLIEKPALRLKPTHRARTARNPADTEVATDQGAWIDTVQTGLPDEAVAPTAWWQRLRPRAAS